MKIYFTKSFKTAYKERIRSIQYLEKRFEARYDLFAEDPTNVTLKDHPLSGILRGFRAFAITGDIRVIYYIYQEIVYFVDIGTHGQVYGRGE